MRNRLFRENQATYFQEFEAKKQIAQDKQELMNYLCNKRGTPTTASQMMAQIRELQNEVASWSEAREFYDPGAASSSGATHVPSQPSAVLSPRTSPR